MTIENQKLDLNSQHKKANLADRNSLLRSTPKPKYLTYDMVVNFIKDSALETNVKEKLLLKLRKCPDGALQNFMDNIDKKIASVIAEMTPKKDKQNLPLDSQGITIDEMVSLRNKLSTESTKEIVDESSTS